MPRQMQLVGFVWTVFVATLFGFLTTDLAEAQLLGRRCGVFDRGHVRGCEDTCRPPRFGGLFRGRFQPCPDPCGASPVVMAANGTLMASPSVVHPSPLLLQQSPPAAYLQPVPQRIPSDGGPNDPVTPCEGSCVFSYNTGTNKWELVSSGCQDSCYCEYPNEQNQKAPATYPPLMSGEVTVMCESELGENYFQLQLTLNHGGIISNLTLAFILDRPIKLQHPHTYRIPAGKSPVGNEQFWEVTVQYDPDMTVETMPIPIGSGPKSRVTYPHGSQEFIHDATSKEFDFQFRGYTVTVRHEP